VGSCAPRRDCRIACNNGESSHIAIPSDHCVTKSRVRSIAPRRKVLRAAHRGSERLIMKTHPSTGLWLQHCIPAPVHSLISLSSRKKFRAGGISQRPRKKTPESGSDTVIHENTDQTHRSCAPLWRQTLGFAHCCHAAASSAEKAERECRNCNEVCRNTAVVGLSSVNVLR
jgi:hypothetical protein